MPTMDDVPCEVMDAIFVKWTKAYNEGWTPDLWTGCDLCEWMRNREFACHECPLGPNFWCVNSRNDSRLNEYYYHDGGDDRRHVWRDTVRKFLEFIKPYCSEEIKCK